MKRVTLWRAALPCAVLTVGCASALDHESVGTSSDRLSGVAEDEASVGATEVAAWNESIATGECTDAKSAVVPCSMMTHAVMTQASPAAPLSSGIAWGVKMDGAAWEMHQASTQDWGVPATPFYDGTTVVGYSTDAAVTYVARDTFVVTAIADSTGGAARGAVIVYTTDAGRTWSEPAWTHPGCDLIGSTGLAPATFWNARQTLVRSHDDEKFEPVVMTAVGHYQCCPAQHLPPGTPPDICGGYFSEAADFGAFTMSANPQFTRATTLITEQDGYERGSTHYLDFVALVDDDLCWDLVAEYPATTDGEGVFSQTKPVASYLGGVCPSSDTFDVTWRTRVTRMCAGTLGTFENWKRGPDVDRDVKSPKCVGDSKRLNSWLPAMGTTPDRKWIGTAVSVGTASGQRIRATELDVSKWPPTLSPWQYRSADPAVGRETEQIMPNLSYRSSGDVALSWIDDRFGEKRGDLGALLGVGSTGGFHVFDLDLVPTTLIAHQSFVDTGIPAERSATHVGLTENRSPTGSAFAGAISKGNRVGTSAFQP